MWYVVVMASVVMYVRSFGTWCMPYFINFFSDLSGHSYRLYFYMQYGMTLLQDACKRGDTETAKLLIDIGADVNECDKVRKSIYVQ